MSSTSHPWQVFPAAFLERLELLFPSPQKEAVLTALCHKRPTTFRANLLKNTPEELAAELSKAGFDVEQSPWLSSAFVLKNRSLRELSEHQLYQEGCLYVQSLSSMIPPLVLAPKPGERVLDLTAAPGSKTTQMAAMMQNQGEILANDTSLVRLFKLQANLEMQGVTVVTTKRGQGQDLWQKFPEFFEKALADVPCSMEGRFLCDSPKTFENWSPKKNKELALRQRALLRSAVSATLPGGTIVYSTCTLSPDENEAVIDWLLKKEQGAVIVEEIELAGVPLEPAVKGWKHHIFAEEVAKTRRILPSALMEGFYVARLKKVRSTLQ
jgi:NOL1/NOP2/sun family putative RNA methylase